jgi:hypothetical protein
MHTSAASADPPPVIRKLDNTTVPIAARSAQREVFECAIVNLRFARESAKNVGSEPQVAREGADPRAL